MNELTIQQAIEYLDISYPTALDLAQKLGRLDTTGRKSGVWKIPAECIRDILVSQVSEVTGRLTRFQQAMN